jgi:hypothetical protein
MLFAAVRRSLMARSDVSNPCQKRSLTEYSGQTTILDTAGYDVNDPTAALAVHCGTRFDAGFRPYRGTRLSRYDASS